MKTIIKKSYQSLSVLLLSTAALSSLAVESGKLKLSEVTTLAKDLRGDGTIGDGVFNIASTLLFWGGIAIIIIGIVSAYSGINKAIKNKREGKPGDWTIGEAVLYGAIQVVIAAIVGLILITISG